jgi:hypothetical protein
MNGKSIRGASYTIAALVALVVTILNGCTEKDTGRADSGAATDTSGGGVAMLVHNGYPADGKTEDWLEYVKRGLDFNIKFEDIDSTALIKYPCKTDDDCSQSGGAVRFLVIPEKLAFTVRWQDALTPAQQKKGYVTAVYWNLERIAVPSLRLPVNTALYQWVGAISDSTYGIQLFYVTADSGVVVVASGTPEDYKFCGDQGHENRRVSAAKLKPTHACPDSAASAQSTQSTQSKKSAMMITERFPEDLWLSCAGGCCQSSLTSVL